MAWTWAKATVRGTSHVRSGTRCQDASAAWRAGSGDEILCVVVSDGAGSAPFGGEGAALICRMVKSRSRAHFQRYGALPSEDDVWSWVDDVRDQIRVAAANRGVEARQFAATLVAGFFTPTDGLIVHVGDGSIVVKTADWFVPSWPESGEYASTTYFLTDDPSPRIRFTKIAEPISAVAAFTDGLERLLLDFANKDAHRPFFNGIFKPLEGSDEPGPKPALSQNLARYLDGSSVNERTDDDKSLILALRT